MTNTLNDFDSADFRAVMSRFATGVCIVTSVDSDGGPVGMTINSFNSVSLDPPLVLWTVGRQAPEYDAFCQASEYNIHLLRESEVHLSNHFATPSDDKFAGQEFDLSSLPRMQKPWQLLKCKAEHSFAAGDHTILVGRVTAIESNAEDDRALLYYASQYHSVGSPLI